MSETVLRYFGRCPTRGCKHRRVIEESSSDSLKRFAGSRGDVLAIIATDGRDWPLYELGDREHNIVMREAGFVCPDHDRIVWFVGGVFTHNPEKVCDGRCMGATGPACDCSCGGANHGGKHL